MVSPATTADSDSDSKPNRPNAPVPITVPSPRAHLHHHHHHLLDHRDTQWARAWEPKGTLRPGAMDGAAKPEAKLVVGEAGYVLEDVPQHRPSSGNNSSFWTTNSGVPVWNNNSAVTVGQRGPILLEDYHLIEKLAQFDKECIHERVVHAQGTSAKGFFQVAHDVSHLMCADFLRAPGVQTPVIVRFSTVMHEREARRP